MKYSIIRCVKTPYFVLSVLISMASLTINVLPDMRINWEVYEDAMYYSSALQFTFQPIYFGGFILVLVIAASLPASCCLIDDHRMKCYIPVTTRVGKKRYIRLRAFSGAFCGGSAVALGFVMHALFCHVLFLPSNPAMYDAHVLPFGGTVYEFMYSSWGGLPMICFATLMIFFTGFVWAMISLAIAVWLPDRIVAIMGPVVIYYLWLWGGLRESVPWLYLSPTALFNDGLTWGVVWESMLLYLALGGVAYMLYRAGLKRGIQDDFQ